MPRKFSDFPAIKQIDFRGEFCFICSTLVQNVYRDGRYLYFLIILVNSTEIDFDLFEIDVDDVVLGPAKITTHTTFTFPPLKEEKLHPVPLTPANTPSPPPAIPTPVQARFHRPPFLQPLQPLSEHITLVVLGSKCTKSSMQSCGTGRRIRLAGQLDFGVLFLKGMKRG